MNGVAFSCAEALKSRLGKEARDLPHAGNGNGMDNGIGTGGGEVAAAEEVHLPPIDQHRRDTLT